MRRAGGERGSVVVFVALAMVPILLLLALVIDAGKWFTHNRQLRTRADAAMQAAGVEYARRWPACEADVGAASAIVDAAKAYAGGVYNTEITNVAPADIDVNDNPCALQPDEFNQPRRWLDMEVTERNITSLSPLFELIGETVSAPEAIRSRSRVELLQAASDTGFVPLAIEDQGIVRAEARFTNACNDDPIGEPVELVRLESTLRGMTLWSPGSGRAAIPLPGSVETSAQCGALFDYVPIAVEVRVASRDSVPLSTLSCQALIVAPFAHCFSNVTQVRVRARNSDLPDEPGDPTDDRPAVRDVILSGNTCSPDPYYARFSQGSGDPCTFAADVFVEWSSRPVGGTCTVRLRVTDVETDGLLDVVDLAGGACPPAEVSPVPWSTTRLVELGATGRPARVSLHYLWEGGVEGEVWNGQTCPCSDEGIIAIHRVNLADDPDPDAQSTDIVELVELTTTSNVDPNAGPVSLLHTVQAGETIFPYLTVGLKSELAPSQFATMRTRFPGTASSGGSRALVCDPAYSNGQVETMFVKRCKPPHAPNSLDGGAWWDGTACPSPAGWFSGPPYANAPWRCIRTEVAPVSVADDVADGIAFRTGNCSNSMDPNATSCTVVQCNELNYYEEYYVTKERPIDPSDRRFVKVFVVPFGGFKGPADGAVPIIHIASFYVTGWRAVGGGPGDPCLDPYNDSGRARPGRVAGYFVSTVSSNTGPVEPNSPCDPGKLRPCRAVITR